MFKFIRQYAEKIDGAIIFPMISLVIFFAFFVVLLVYVKKMGRKRADQLSQIPLDNEALSNSTL
jgi:hypothetical protein